jgi:splicing factor 3B subunit 1
VKHLALGVAGLGCEDSMMHLMNLVWPNCFETSPHVIGAVMEAIEAMRVTLGPGTLLSYVLQGLFHPARKVREVSNSTSSPISIFKSRSRILLTLLSSCLQK